MPCKEGQPLLMEYSWWVPLKQVVRKKLFGKRYIQFIDYARILAFQYETGALLGRAMRDKLDIFHKMLLKPGADINNSITSIQSKAKDHLKKFTEEEGKEPDTFYDFIATRELTKAEKVMGLSTVDVHEPKRHLKELGKLYGHELALDDVYTNIFNSGLIGIGFGSSFPELTVKMYKNAYENIDKNGWPEAGSHGLNLPEAPDIVSFEEREESILRMFAAYTAEFYPELLDPLDLRSYTGK